MYVNFYTVIYILKKTDKKKSAQIMWCIKYLEKYKKNLWCRRLLLQWFISSIENSDISLPNVGTDKRIRWKSIINLMCLNFLLLIILISRCRKLL